MTRPYPFWLHDGIVNLIKLGKRVLTVKKYVIELNEDDYQMLKDCHSKNPSIMKALENATEEN